MKENVEERRRFKSWATQSCRETNLKRDHWQRATRQQTRWSNASSPIESRVHKRRRENARTRLAGAGASLPHGFKNGGVAFSWDLEDDRHLIVTRFCGLPVDNLRRKTTTSHLGDQRPHCMAHWHTSSANANYDHSHLTPSCETCVHQHGQNLIQQTPAPRQTN